MTVYGINVYTNDGNDHVGNIIFDDPRTRDEAIKKIRDKMIELYPDYDPDMNIWPFDKHINHEIDEKEFNDLMYEFGDLTKEY